MNESCSVDAGFIHPENLHNWYTAQQLATAAILAEEMAELRDAERSRSEEEAEERQRRRTVALEALERCARGKGSSAQVAAANSILEHL